MKPRTIFWLISAFQLFSLSAFQALAQPTNPIASTAANLRPLSVTTNAALFGIGTNLFWTNLSLIRAAGIVAPTNAGTLGYVPVYKAAGAFAWEAQSGAQTNIAVAGVTNAGTLAYSNTTPFLTLITNIAAGGSQTPWVSDIDAAGYALTNVTVVTGVDVSFNFNSARFGESGNPSGFQSYYFGSNNNDLATSSGNNFLFGNSHLLWGAENKHNFVFGDDHLESNTLHTATFGVANLLNRVTNSFVFGNRHTNLNVARSFTFGDDIDLEKSSHLFAFGSNITYRTGSDIDPQYNLLFGRNIDINTSESAKWLLAFGDGITITGIIHKPMLLVGDRIASANSGGYGAAIGSDLVIGGLGAFALGYGIHSTNIGSFAFGDTNSGSLLNTTTNNQFILRFQNGLSINTNSAGTNAIKVAGNVDATGFSINGTPISLVGGGGGGAGFLSNGVAALVMDTWYTNTTEYYLHVSATLDMSASSGVNGATVEFARDDEPDGTDDYNKRMALTASADSVSTFATMELSSWVAPGGAFRYWDISDGAGAASFYSDADLLYVGAGGGTSANQTNVTIYSTPSTADTLILRSDAIEYAVFNPTNIALESTVVTIPSPVLNSGNYTNTATVHLRTNAAPANVTVGTTPPDVWLPIAGTNGVIYYVPGWTPH